MTAAFLQSELSTLISDSKRRHNEVRVSAEQSLTELKSISVTSETQLAADLLRRPRFVDPFILACKSKNVKLANTGTTCLQRLTASRAIAGTRLQDVLDAFHEVVSAGFDTQFKILQTLPSFLQLYADDLHGELLARTLEICATLQASKTAVVSNTAAATFQQLVTTVCEHAESAISARHSGDGDPDGNERSTALHEASQEDADKLFVDFCLLLDQEEPRFVRVPRLSSDFLLEVLHTVLSNDDSHLVERTDQMEACRSHLIPGLSPILTRKDNFSAMVRALGVLRLLVRRYATRLKDPLGQTLSYLVTALDRDASPMWKRALCLEFFESLCSDFATLRRLYELSDLAETPDNLVTALLAALVRIAAEDPSLIGLGRQSTVPLQRGTETKDDEIANIEAQGLGGAITSFTSSDSHVTGISTEWSQIESPLMDQAGRSSPPTVPSTYIYTLVLGCIASVCDGLSKFIMPLSVSNRAHTTDEETTTSKSARVVTPAQKYQRLLNPLTLSNHPQEAQVRTCAAMIDSCWPAILATSSTFLNAALDSSFYHVLIRSVQKLAQVSGILGLSTPRDALLTTLAKSSLPPNAANIISAFQGPKPGRSAGDEGDSHQPASTPSIESPTSRPFDSGIQTLNVRHLLCLRALLNLGIALGPTLEPDSWFILVEAMQQVEAFMTMPTTIQTASTMNSPRIGTAGQDGTTTLAAEILAVQTATKRMLESTRSYPDEAFSSLIHALFRLLRQSATSSQTLPAEDMMSSPMATGNERRMHRPARSMSALWTAKSRVRDLEVGFVLAKSSDLSRINLHRYASVSAQACSWDLIVKQLLQIAQSTDVEGNLRLQSASIMDLIAMETVKLLDDRSDSPDDIDIIQCLCLQTLLQQLQFARQTGARLSENGDVSLEIHKRLLEALESIVNHCGDSLKAGWSLAFEILTGTFSRPTAEDHAGKASNFILSAAPSAPILHVAFRSVQLIASDFLGVLNGHSSACLIQLLYQFGSQHSDLNTALTTTTLLWTVASHLLKQIDSIDLTEMPLFNALLQDRDLSSESETTTLLWALTVVQLARLCDDDRAEVRNAAIKMLLKVMDASSTSLSTEGWNTTLTNAPLAILRSYLEQLTQVEDVPADLAESLTELTDGTVILIVQNLDIIVTHKLFTNVWSDLMTIFEGLVQARVKVAFPLVFTNLSKLVAALKPVTTIDPAILMAPTLQLWSKYHPADVVEEREEKDTVAAAQKSNQAAFVAHAHMFVETYHTNPDVTKAFVYRGQGIEGILSRSIRRTVLMAIHPPYSSDVKRLAPEQVEVTDMLHLLHTLSQGRIAEYTSFILKLLRETLSIEDGHVHAHPRVTTNSKAGQRPTFIALSSACVDIIRSLIVQYAKEEAFIQILAVQECQEICSALIKTKYSDFPVNHEAPLWRNATLTAVTLLGALQQHLHSSRSKCSHIELDDVARNVSSTAANVLGSGGLTSTITTPSEQTLLDDEAFDMEHFQLLHAAAVPILCDESVREESCQRYAITLFHASLLAKPWFFDFPDDLAKKPLENFYVVRAGSVHKPEFGARRRICYAALNALFELVARATAGIADAAEADPDSRVRKRKLARAAAPYVLLRVAHCLKTFLADQHLRGLTPPPMPQQVEMQTILAACLALRCDDAAFTPLLLWTSGSGSRSGSDSGPNSDSDAGPRADPGPTIADGDKDGDEDGKTHLRALYPLILRCQTFWRTLLRLEGAGAWQAGEAGRGIEAALLCRWSEVLSERWGISG